ncbi:transposase [Streptomyces fagopyri]|uniref:transposase n=1 Tax=Streptomyces fagopyri TaxID=2662397 RepID=UPI00381E4414
MIDDLAAAAWDRELDDLLLCIGHRFGRADLRRRTRDDVRALLGPVGRKNGWQLAEYADHHTPAGLQRLLNGATWHADTVRDDLPIYVAEKLGEDSGVLILDDTGFVKMGITSAGVQKQYSGTAGACLWITVRFDLSGGSRQAGELEAVRGSGRAVHAAV